MSTRATPEQKVEAERQAQAEYRKTHSRDGYALGSENYPNNREGRRRLARSWKRAQR